MLPSDPELIGNGCLQHAGAGRRGKDYFHHHIHLMAGDVELLVAIAFCHWIGMYSVADQEEKDTVEVLKNVVFS